MIFLRLFTGYFLQIAPFAFLCLYPFYPQFRFSIKKTAGITLGIILFMDLLFSGLGCYLSAVSPPEALLYQPMNAVFMAFLIPLFLWLLFAAKTRWQQKLFIFSFSLTSALSITSFSNAIYSIYKGKNNHDRLPYEGISIFTILIFTAISLPLLFLILKKSYMPLSEGMTESEKNYLAILSLILFLFLASGLSFIDYDYLINPMTLFLFIALIFLIFFIYVILFKILSLFHEKSVEQQNSLNLRHQLEIRDEQFHRFNDRIEQSRHMRHNLKHTMLTIQSFLNSSEPEKAQSYIHSYLKSTEEMEIIKLSDLPVINWIVSYYYTLAKDNEISFTIHISTPPTEQIAIHDADLSVLLGNILENAVTAATRIKKEKRFIHLNITYSGKMMAITVDNSFDGKVNKNGAQYLSTKKNHTGIGLQSIEWIAEKYGGGIEFTNTDTTFHTSVMLNISPEATGE